MAIATDRGTITHSPKPHEGVTTRTVDKFTGSVPSIVYLGLAIGSMALSASLMATKRRDAAIFVGHWAPALLVIGLYNKLVKVEEHLSEQLDSSHLAVGV